MHTTLWTVSLATALLVGCGPAQPPPDDPTGQDPPPVVEPTPDPNPNPVVPPPPDGPVEPDATPAGPDPAAMQTLLQDRCTSCHGLDKVDAERTDHAGWTEIVDRMVGMGAVLTDAERTDLIEYLATRTPS